jgi:hypothetical protein
LLVVLYGNVTWSLALREEYRQKVLENKVLRRIYEPKKGELQEAVENYIKKSFIGYKIKEDEVGGKIRTKVG